MSALSQGHDCTQLIVHPTFSDGLLSVVIPTLQTKRDIVVVFKGKGPKLYTFRQGKDIDNVGKVVWASGIFLAQYLADEVASLRGKRAIELGCGSAPLASLVLGELGCHTICTDGMDDVLALAKVNIDSNWQGQHHPAHASRPKCTLLRWGNEAEIDHVLEEGVFDIVVAADVIYMEKAHTALLGTLSKVTDENSVIYIAFQIRLHAFEVNFFTETIHRFGFHHEIVWTNDSTPEVQIARLQKVKIEQAVKRCDKLLSS